MLEEESHAGSFSLFMQTGNKEDIEKFSKRTVKVEILS